MSTFDSVRYYMALVLLVSGPGSALSWFPIHPFAAFWRRVGLGWAYTVGFGTYVAAGVVGWIFRAPLLSIDFGAEPVTIGAGVVLMVVSAVMRRIWHRQLSIKTLFGLPELAPDRHPGKILTQGAYAWVRHPRYLEVLVGFLGWALFCNYLAAYLVWAFLVVALLILIPMEERELVQRFGPAYEEYRRKVPALVPRPRRSRSG
jgi:protein-S-isoprenylcysteine O-methyltransferase Ste14